MFFKKLKYYNALDFQLRIGYDQYENTRINSRVAYTEVSIIGKGVYEYSDTKAKQEMASLAKEVLNKAKALNLVEK